MLSRIVIKQLFGILFSSSMRLWMSEAFRMEGMPKIYIAVVARA